MKKSLNSYGFSALEVALVVVVMGIIGGTGYSVYNSQKESNTVPDSTSADDPVTDKNPSAQNNADDRTTGWKLYSNDSGKFSAKFPPNWETAANSEYCMEGLLLIGVKMSDGTSSVGKCGSDGAGAFGQMTITWDKDKTDLSSCGYAEGPWQIKSKESVTVAGVSAVKTSATHTANETESGGEAKGTKSVQYCFVGNNMRYIASYTKRANYPDVLKDFETMVTKTFALN